MPIDKTSDEWESATTVDWAISDVAELLVGNNERAFSAEEVTDLLVEDRPETIPKSLRNSYKNGEKEPLVGYISSVLAHMQWRELVDYRIVDEGDERIIYYTWTSGGRYPISDIVDNLSPKVESLEERVDENTKNLRERIRRIDNRLYELELA